MAITYIGSQEDSYNTTPAIGSRTVSINIGTRTNGLLVVGIGLYDTLLSGVIVTSPR